MTKLQALKKSIRVLGGQTALARACQNGVKQQHVYNWLNRSEGLPAAYAMLVQIATEEAGETVNACDLCPDHFPKAAAA